MKPILMVFCLLAFMTIAHSSDNDTNGSKEDVAGAKFNEYKIKVYTLDDSGNKKENDKSQFDIKPYFYGFYVQFEQNAKCVELKLNNTSLWKLNGSNKHPTRVYFDLTLKVCLIQFDDKFRGHYLRAASGLHVDITIDPFLPSDFKFLGLGAQDGTTPDGKTHNDQSSTPPLVEFVPQGTANGLPEYELRDYGHSYTFIFVPADRCTQIKYKDEVLWQHDSTEFGTSFPIQFSIMKFWKTANVFFPGYAFILEHKFESNQWKFKKRKELKKLETNKFTFKTTKIDGSDVSDASSRYTTKEGAKKEYEIQANDGFAFFEVSYNNKPVWNYDDMCGSKSSSASSSSCRSRPTLIFAKLNESYFHICSDDGPLVYHFANDGWKLTFDKDKIINGNGAPSNGST